MLGKTLVTNHEVRRNLNETNLGWVVSATSFKSNCVESVKPTKILGL